jgi:hypothetical protein
MVIGLLVLTAIPTVTGVAQAMSAQKNEKQRKEDAERMKKFHIDISCETDSPTPHELHGRRVVLKNERLWIGMAGAQNPSTEGYVSEAFLIEYPDNEVSDPKLKV